MSEHIHVSLHLGVERDGGDEVGVDLGLDHGLQLRGHLSAVLTGVHDVAEGGFGTRRELKREREGQRDQVKVIRGRDVARVAVPDTQEAVLSQRGISVSSSRNSFGDMS
jgi:hypothetical protein